MKFSYEIKKLADDEVSLRLVGYLDENATLPKINELPLDGKLVIDFSRVNFINSRGIKSWIRLVSEIAKTPRYDIIFRGCRPPIIGQVNSIAGFLPSSAKVESVYIDLFCDDCQGEFSFYYPVLNLEAAPDDEQIIGNFFNSSETNNEENECKHESIEIDFAPEKFFRFLERQI